MIVFCTPVHFRSRARFGDRADRAFSLFKYVTKMLISCTLQQHANSIQPPGQDQALKPPDGGSLSHSKLNFCTKLFIIGYPRGSYRNLYQFADTNSYDSCVCPPSPLRPSRWRLLPPQGRPPFAEPTAPHHLIRGYGRLRAV